MQKDKDVIIGGIYRHFKGGVYKVLMESLYSEDKTPMITYTCVQLSPNNDGKCNCGECYNGKTCTRPKWDYKGEPGFLTEVDHEKYPDSQQKMRFELIRLHDGTEVTQS